MVQRVDKITLEVVEASLHRNPVNLLVRSVAVASLLQFALKGPLPRSRSSFVAAELCVEPAFQKFEANLRISRHARAPSLHLVRPGMMQFAATDGVVRVAPELTGKGVVIRL